MRQSSTRLSSKRHACQCRASATGLRQRRWPVLPARLAVLALALVAGLGVTTQANAQTNAQTQAQTAGPAPPGQARSADLSEPVRQCPLIRPAGLRPEQVDTLVLARLATALQRPASQIDTQRSFADLAGGPGDEALFRFALQAIGESLGFDASTRVVEAARALGQAQAPAELSVATLQAISRQAYQAGSDAPPPQAAAGQRYRLASLAVRTPGMATGWHLLRCGHDQVTFWRQGAVDGEVATAVARMTGLPAWTTQDAFVSYLRGVALAAVPPGYTVRKLQVHGVMGSSQPCVDVSLLARAEDAPYRMRGRFCYASLQATHGPTLMFSHAGTDDVLQFEREAMDFIQAALPR